jgi:ribonuclease P protein component
MTNRLYTFTKNERLSSRKSIAALFDDGNSFFSFPFTVIWRFCDPIPGSNIQVAISVPKKTFRRAVDRNHIKRIVREAWRHQKHGLSNYLEQQDKQVVIMLIYMAKEIHGQDDINNRIARLIDKFSLLLRNYSQIETGEETGKKENR